MAVPLTAGQFVKIVALQAGSDVVVALRDPQQRVLMESDMPNAAFGAETVAAIADSDGDYVVEVKLANPRASNGSYQVTLEAARAATPVDRELASAYRSLVQANLLRQKRTPDTRRQATDLLQQIRPVFATVEDHYSEAMAVFMAGAMSAESGEIATALRYAEAAAELFQQAGDWFQQAQARNNMGGMLDLLGEPRKALESYRLALALDRANNASEAESQVLNNIGKLEGDLGHWQDSLEDYGQALLLVQRAGNIQREGVIRHNIGNTYRFLGDMESATPILEQALALSRAAKDRREEADTLQVLGRTLVISNQPEKAVEYQRQALAIEIALGDRRREAELRREIGVTLAELGKIAEAEESIRVAVEGERAVQDRRNAAVALRELSRVLTLAGRPAEALLPAEEAVAEFRAIGASSSEAIALEASARAESGLGNLHAASKHMEESLRLTEESRTRTDSEQFRASFLASRQDSYGFYIDLLMRLGQPEAALEAAERSRARSMLDLLADTGRGLREGVDPKLLEREQEISDRLNAKGARLLTSPRKAAQLQQEVRELEIDYQDVEAAIRKSSPRYAALTQPEPLKLTEMQRDLLDEGTLLLEYALGESHSYLWAVSRRDLHVWQLPSRARIEEQADKVSALLTARSTIKRLETPAERQVRIAEADTALPQAARQLSDMILAPAAAALGNRRLVIVPDGALQRLPFSILPLDTEPRPSGSGPDTPLIVSHEVVMLPSASAVSLLRREITGRKPAPKTLAVFADPVFDRSDPRAGQNAQPAAPHTGSAAESTRILEHLSEPGESASVPSALKIPRLPYTAQEADEILRVAHDPASLKAVSFQASRATATSGRLSDYRYLHFATHGYLDTERPSLSALVLSQIDEKGQPEDGFLRVNDIYNTRLSADLVVLSACQTGLGKEVRGEGVMGLTRAFLYAGAPRVIVSLWNVNDRATAALMSSLYRRMLREGKRPSAALRDAQLEMRKQKQWASPYYWAAFVQHGEWR